MRELGIGICIVLWSLSPVAAQSDTTALNKNLLLGNWSGTQTATVDGKQTTSKVVLEFMVKGKATIAVDGGKAFAARWKAKSNAIEFTPAKTSGLPKTKWIEISVGPAKLSATANVVKPKAGTPSSFTLTFERERKRVFTPDDQYPE